MSVVEALAFEPSRLEFTRWLLLTHRTNAVAMIAHRNGTKEELILRLLDRQCPETDNDPLIRTPSYNPNRRVRYSDRASLSNIGRPASSLSACLRSCLTESLAWLVLAGGR
jgi:hypothetical protein